MRIEDCCPCGVISPLLYCCYDRRTTEKSHGFVMNQPIMPSDAIVLRSVEEARDEILRHFSPLASESVPLMQALGRVLAEDVQADIDVPPFANSAMDGYAVRGADLQSVTPD